MKLMEEIFGTYFDACYSHTTVPPQQKAEIRQAFYSGALAVITEITVQLQHNESLGDKLLKQIIGELEEYGQQRTAELDKNS